MSTLFQWLAINASVLAVLVTVGVAVLLVCCLECSNCSNSKDDDDLFHRHEM
jgi:outer membrane biogenesis lipoprotein LolB